MACRRSEVLWEHQADKMQDVKSCWICSLCLPSVCLFLLFQSDPQCNRPDCVLTKKAEDPSSYRSARIKYFNQGDLRCIRKIPWLVARSSGYGPDYKCFCLALPHINKCTPLLCSTLFILNMLSLTLRQALLTKSSQTAVPLPQS